MACDIHDAVHSREAKSIDKIEKIAARELARIG
jgi:hypothetical protein